MQNSEYRVIGDEAFWIEHDPDERRGYRVRRRRGDQELPGAGPYRYHQQAAQVLENWVSLAMGRVKG